MKIHVYPPSPNSKKVLFTDAHVGANSEIAICDLQTGAQYAPEMLALNPNGKMPVLEFQDGSSLWESNAITNRVASDAKSDIWPASQARYDIMRWQFWESCHWTPACAKYLSRHLFNNEDIDMKEAETTFRKFAEVLDDALKGRDWLVGDGLTTADIAVSMILAYREPCQMPLADYGNIVRWVSAIEAMPAWAAANPQS